MRLRFLPLYLLAVALLVPGLYLLRAFELAAKMLALVSLVTHLPWQVGALLPAAEALLLTICFLPFYAWALSSRVRWPWVGGVLLILFSVFQYSESYSYGHLSGAAPGTANACPWFSVSGFSYAASRALSLPPELQIDFNNEQCMSLRLAHDFGMDWEGFKAKAYDPAYIPAHYAQNVPFPLGILVASFISHQREVSKDPHALSRWMDETVLGYRWLEATVFVLEHQQRRVAQEEALVLKKLSSQILDKLPILVATEGSKLASAEKEHPEARAELSGYVQGFPGLSARLRLSVESY